MSEKQIIQTIDPDSIEIGTPSKMGKIKVYGDFDNKEDFKNKIDNAIQLAEYAEGEYGK